jgi:hypothetical protein
MALDTKRLAPERSWMSVADQLGYLDQMHLIRDFQSLAGKVAKRDISAEWRLPTVVISFARESSSSPWPRSTDTSSHMTRPVI